MGGIVFKEEARSHFLVKDTGKVDWAKVSQRFEDLKSKKLSLVNKHFMSKEPVDVAAWAATLSDEDQVFN